MAKTLAATFVAGIVLGAVIMTALDGGWIDDDLGYAFNPLISFWWVGPLLIVASVIVARARIDRRIPAYLGGVGAVWFGFLVGVYGWSFATCAMCLA
jgi:hypothetical protein